MAEIDVSTAAEVAAERGRVLVNTGFGWRLWGEGTEETVRGLNQNATTDEGKGTTFKWEPFPQRTEH